METKTPVVRPRKRKYNHAFDIAFELDTDHDVAHVTSQELIAALRKRLLDLENNGEEIIEACGMPFDTYENY